MLQQINQRRVWGLLTVGIRKALKPSDRFKIQARLKFFDQPAFAGSGIAINRHDNTLSRFDLFKSLTRRKVYALPGTKGAYTNVVALKSNAAAAQKVVAIKSLGDSATEGCDIKYLSVGQAVTIGDTGNSEVNEIASIDEDAYELTMLNNLANNYQTANDAYVKKFPQALSGTRIQDILSEMGWPSSLQDLDTGQNTIAELVPGTGGESGLKHIQDVAESEGGIFFMAGDGAATFQDKIARLSSPLNTVQATFSDDGNDQKYNAGRPKDDEALIYNECLVDGDNITGQLYRDIDYQDNQGQRALPRTGSLLVYDAEAFEQAYIIVERNKDSVLRIPDLLVLPDADRSNLYPKAWGYELSTLINVELDESPNTAGLDKNYHIEGIEHRRRASGLWETRWQLWDQNLFRVIEAEHTGYLYENTVAPGTYTDCHDAAVADSATDDDAIVSVGQAQDWGGADDFKIWRGFLQFDTSVIGATQTIHSAQLIMEISGYFVIDNEFGITIVYAGAGVANPLAVADYNTMMGQTTSWGSVTIGTPAVNKKVIVIDLNAAGIAAIDKSGTTYFGLRSSRDISSTSPGTGASYQEWVTIEVTNFNPRLAVKLNEAF